MIQARRPSWPPSWQITPLSAQTPPPCPVCSELPFPPAGTHLADFCTEPNGSSECSPCKREEFMEYPNVFHSCYECRKCREDQVELSPCQATRNTECACKEGTFCDPDLPCEMCEKCQPRCPEGQMVLSPCTPYRDLQCGPAKGTDLFYVWIIIGVVILVIIVLLICKYLSCCPEGPGHGRADGCSWNPDTIRASLLPQNYLTQKLRWYRRVNVGTQDNDLNEQRSRDQPLPVESPSCKTCSLQSTARALCGFKAAAEQTALLSLARTPRGSSPCSWPAASPEPGNRDVLGVEGGVLPQEPLERGRGSPVPALGGLGDSFCARAWWVLQTLPLQVMLQRAPCPRERPRRDLVPQTGKEPIPALRGTFYIFAGINYSYWKKFGRSLDVQENDLPLDRAQDSFYEMLNKWLEREGSKASVNTLLETLDQLGLSGIADDISSELLRRGLFKPAGAEEQGGSCASVP
ncbi:tumor necrosis factor receptor superfamily member 10B-like [Empidonax traillii]|uniref:tumor necrosis factor receptor superfamily member 10B-like n=1 Tax=Empidonax traillii TaxID=164674 RepID=UPI000FFCEAB8|nr:tumor necrosis factor receptor superfamily member 10B-like [Empidonax traillii]